MLENPLHIHAKYILHRGHILEHHDIEVFLSTTLQGFAITTKTVPGDSESGAA
jgi:hypothetical protein